MDESEHNKIVRSEFEMPRPASRMPTVIAGALAIIVLGLLAMQFWPAGDNRAAVSDSSPRVERSPTTPPDVKPPSDLTQPVPKSPAQ